MNIIFRAIWRRVQKGVLEAVETPEGQTALERFRRLWSVVEAALEVAGRDLDDQDGCLELESALADDPDAAREAIDELGKRRTDYLHDRAYRLLAAAVDGTPVRPIDPAVRSLFLAEERLGRTPLNDAFEQLAALEPRLLKLVGQRFEGQSAKQGWRRSDADSDFLVGRFAKGPHELLKTDLAQKVVDEYVAAGKHGPQPVKDPTPFFERKKHTHGFTVAPFQKDARPRARN